MEALHLNISGDYITNICRELFWYNDSKSYESVLEILLGALVCDQLTIEQRTEIANRILLGTADITGSTADGTYGVTEYDDSDDNPNEVRNIFSEYSKLKLEMKKLKEDLQSAQEEYIELIEYTNGEIDSSDLSDKTRENLGLNSKSNSSMLDEFMFANKFEDNYGWLEPNGTFHVVDWGKHQEWAHDISMNRYHDQYVEWNGSHLSRAKAGDFLVNEKGWILLESASQGIAIPQISESRAITKAQRDFLYGYYSDRDLNDLANKYMEED